MIKYTNKIFITLFLLTLSVLGFGQKVETYLGLNGGHLNQSGYSQRAYGGIELNIKFENNIGIHYTMLGGEKHFHMPGGPIYGGLLGLAIVTNNNDSTKNKIGVALLLGLLTAIVPEGAFYDIKISKWLSISPYLSPFQYEKLRNRNESKSTWSSSGAAGSRFHFYMLKGKMRISPYLEYKIHYDEKRGDGICGGLNVAIRTSKIASSTETKKKN